MPRCKSRVRKAIARSTQLRRAFEAEIDDRFNEIIGARTSEARIAAMAGMIELLKRIAASDFGLWSFQEYLCRPVVTSNGSREDFETTKAMIAEIVNRHLAACTPGSVRHRPKYAR